MKGARQRSCAYACLGVLLSASAPSGFGEESSPAAGLSRLVRDGKAALDLRYRFETVDRNDFDRRAEASLLRSRLRLESAEKSGFSALLEIDNVTSIGVDDYNSTENGKSEFPTIADPEGTDLNQAFLKVAAEYADLTAGRQRIVIDDRRIIGSKPWRNNEQTYDGLRLRWRAQPGLELDASYVGRVNRIFGPDDGSNPADWEGDSFFLRSNYQFAPAHEVSVFLYLLEVEAQAGFSAAQTVNNASDSFGLTYRGEFSGVNLRGSVATQTDAADSRLRYRAPYYVVELDAPLAGVRLKASHEVLGSDNGVGFATPLANGHRHNGWADMFLSTPRDGLRDTSVALSGNLGALALTARFHHFRAEASGTDFGNEVDLEARWKVSEWLTATLKAAVFDSDAPARYPDTKKAWLVLRVRL